MLGEITTSKTQRIGQGRLGSERPSRPMPRTCISLCDAAGWDGPHYSVEYRGTSLMIRKRSPLRPYRRPVPRVLGGSQGGGRFLMSEVTLYAGCDPAEFRRVRDQICTTQGPELNCLRQVDI